MMRPGELYGKNAEPNLDLDEPTGGCKVKKDVGMSRHPSVMFF